MGRTMRRRLQKRNTQEWSHGLGGDTGFIRLTRWMLANGWEPQCRLRPTTFPATGRGLLAKQHIAAGEIIVKIPHQLLITIKTVSDSDIGRVFNNKKTFLTQQVLSAFLVWEKHKGSESFWDKYLGSLPGTFSTPVFCPAEHLLALPSYLGDEASNMKTGIEELFEDVCRCLEASESCPHCGQSFVQIFQPDVFLWAWFVINSRAVYISPELSGSHQINVADTNCLALAPYLDMFNHSHEAQVQACLVESDGSYQIKTLVPYSKNQQVFINYGSHSNLKLFLEYGFILHKNPNDAVPLRFSDILELIGTLYPGQKHATKKRYNFLKSHGLLKDTNCCTDGLSWSAKVLIYVLISPESIEPKTIQSKVFSNDFSAAEMETIANVGRMLIERKKLELSTQLLDLEFVRDSLIQKELVSDSLFLAVELMKEFLDVLAESERTLSCYN